jgi:hypothetical protein
MNNKLPLLFDSKNMDSLAYAFAEAELFYPDINKNGNEKQLASDDDFDKVNKILNETDSQIIEKYTKKLMELEQQLNQMNFLQHKENSLQTENKLSVKQNANKQEKQQENYSTTEKIKFKNLFNLSKDIVMRKLLKTIDLMNQEMSIIKITKF